MFIAVALVTGSKLYALDKHKGDATNLFKFFAISFKRLRKNTRKLSTYLQNHEANDQKCMKM